MKTLKILPWLARRAGIDEERADELWAEAIRHATEKTGWVGTPEYWKSAMDRLLELIEVERTTPGKAGPKPVSRISQPKNLDFDARGRRLFLDLRSRFAAVLGDPLTGSFHFSR